MKNYILIKDEELNLLTKKDLQEKHNDAVETIWLLQEKVRLLNEDYDEMARAYEEVSTKLYG